MRRFLSIISLFALASCATLTAPNTQRVGVSSDPVGASCVLKNKVGEWSIPRTPGSVRVVRDYSPLKVTCHYNEAVGTTTLDAHTRARTYGNIALGGVPALVDAYTGEGYEYLPLNAHVRLGR